MRVQHTALLDRCRGPCFPPIMIGCFNRLCKDDQVLTRPQCIESPLDISPRMVTGVHAVSPGGVDLMASLLRRHSLSLSPSLSPLDGLLHRGSS